MKYFNCHTHFSNHENFEVLSATLNQTFPRFYSLGIHPWDSTSYDENTKKMVAAKSQSMGCVAIGEIGLDGLKGPDLEVQRRVFLSQAELAERYELPVIIHCVKAWNDIREVKRKLNPNQVWIYHGFAQSTIVNEVVQEHLMISLGARILNHPKKQEIVEAIPNHLLLLETDDQEIEIEAVYQAVADLKKISLQALAQIIEQNFKKTFPKWQLI